MMGITEIRSNYHGKMIIDLPRVPLLMSINTDIIRSNRVIFPSFIFSQIDVLAKFCYFFLPRVNLELFLI